MKTETTFMRTRRNELRAVSRGALAAVIVFLTGFCVLLAFWNIGEYDPALPGLFDYRAATWGDAVCLPLLSGSLVTYAFFRRGQEKPRRLAEIIASLIFGAAAAVAQAQWLISDSTGLNWTIPRQHHFNAPGWWHAIFFVAMFAALGFGFTRFFKLKKAEIQEKKQLFTDLEDTSILYDGFQMIVQTILWFAGALFLFLLALDNYATEQNYFRPLLILLVLLLAVFGIFYIAIFGAAKAISIKKYRKLAKSEIAPILSGVFSAFALANIMYGGIHTNIWYIVACAFLVVVLVMPDENKKPQMALYYVLISIPALLLECAISSQIAFASSAVICCLAILVPCLIAVCQENSNETFKLRHIVLSAVIILLCIALLITLFPERAANDNQSLLESLIGLVFSLSIPNYVKWTFAGLVAVENEGKLDIVKKKQGLLYFLYALIMVGAVILVVNIFFPNILLYSPNEMSTNGLSVFAILAFAISVLFLFVLGLDRFRQSNVSKIFALVCLSVAYMSVLFVTLSSDAFVAFSFRNLEWYFYFSIVAIILYPFSVICGFKYNLCNLRSISADKYIVVSQVFIFAGLLTNAFASAVKMLYYRSLLSIGVNLLYIMVLGAVLPALIGRVIRQSCEEPQLAKNGQVGGILQDGFMYGISIIMNELLSIFLLPSISVVLELKFTPILTFSAALFAFLVLVSWLLNFCITNNISHYKDRKSDLNKKKKESEPRLEQQLTALKKYLTLQNIFAFGNTLPYSLFTIVKIIVEYVVSDEKGWKGLKYRFFPQ